MINSPIKFYPKNQYRKLNDAQATRINKDHKATVSVDSEGNLQYLSETIITPKGISKENTKISVVPNADEKVTSISEVEHLFAGIVHMNVILTNACNLSCTYCYEQHNKDFGRFTEESLMDAYNFLLHTSKAENKRMQFFGGEPLIHKDLILNFIEKNKDYLEQNAIGEQKQVISTITNGILLTPEFINRYFAVDFTYMLISLDTLDADLDHRELSQQQIDKIVNSIDLIPAHAKDRVWMRNTISRETVADLKNYIDTVYAKGIRNIIIHPLILDSTKGFILWSDEEWNTLHEVILSAITRYHDLEISFSEGVGKKGENNCMVGSDMIAIDGSGDFSGCYFFTNQKANGTGHTILGNVFTNSVYVDRYVHFQKEFMKMFEEEEQCKSCNYRRHCYQCPAGNLDTGPKMFRPDNMCQKVVKLYLDLNNDVARKQFEIKYNNTVKQLEEQGEDQTFTNFGFYLMYVMLAGRHASATEERNNPQVSAGKMFATWKAAVESKSQIRYNSYNDFINSLPTPTEEITVKELYEFLLEHLGMSSEKSKSFNELTLESKAGYFVLLQFLALNHKNNQITESLAKSIIEAN